MKMIRFLEAAGVLKHMVNENTGRVDDIKTSIELAKMWMAFEKIIEGYNADLAAIPEYLSDDQKRDAISKIQQAEVDISHVPTIAYQHLRHCQISVSKDGPHTTFVKMPPALLAVIMPFIKNA